MASPEPSRRPSTLESTTLLLTAMWANTACHIFGTKFCLPPQNPKLNNIPLLLNISALEVKTTVGYQHPGQHGKITSVQNQKQLANNI